MNSHPVQLLEPVFRFLDRMIHDHGDVLYMMLVYVSIPLIAWILNGGLRRKSSRQTSGITVPIIVIRPPVSPPTFAACHWRKPGTRAMAIGRR